MALDHKDLAKEIWKAMRQKTNKHIRTDPKTGTVSVRTTFHPPNAKTFEPMAKAIVEHIKDNAEVEFSSVDTIVSPPGTAGGPCRGALRRGEVK